MISILRKENRVIFKLQSCNDTVIIPSSKYPLESKPYQIISRENTEPITDKRIIEIFDSVQAKVGHCFSNSGTLVKLLRDAGYDAKQYVGWVFTDDNYPVHHSFVMLDNHILDLSVEFLEKDIEYIRKITTEQALSPEETRELFIEHHTKKINIPNHEKCNFGKCDNMYLYCAAEGTEHEGKIRNQRLRQDYPDHPAFRNVKKGMTKIQEMLVNRNLLDLR